MSAVSQLCEVGCFGAACVRYGSRIKSNVHFFLSQPGSIISNVTQTFEFKSRLVRVSSTYPLRQFY
jgi:hypothetical protein